MELDQALENIKRVESTFAKEEILCIREHKSEAIPQLLQLVQDIADDPDKYLDSLEDSDDPAYAMFLLAEFGVNDALEPFLKILEFEGETADFILGDMVTEDCGRLIASVAHESDVARIKLVVENVEIDSYQRIAALEALVVMHFAGAYPREELVSYLGYLLKLALESDDDNVDMFITFVLPVCHVVDTKEHFPLILELYDKEIIDESVIRREDFIEDIVLEKHIRERYTPIDDTIKEMQEWHCFKPEPKPHKQAQSSKSKPAESKKVGRNDPCPCGSGKKYKKCCFNKG